MKLLQNKKTGGIGWLYANRGENYDVLDEDGRVMAVYGSLAELNAKWEDYEEPDEIWYIDWEGNIRSADIGNDWERERQIGNYFESREEAEQAVNKLKAFKRLKDTITCIDRASFDSVGTATLFIRYKGKHHKKVNKDLGILLGGEE